MGIGSEEGEIEVVYIVFSFLFFVCFEADHDLKLAELDKLLLLFSDVTVNGV